MNRLLATIHADMLLQFRNGFYYATAFVLVFWIVVISKLPPLNLNWLLPVFVLDNLVISTFFFTGGLVLLEKGEGTLSAQVVTPLRFWEYLGSKVLTLTLLALVQNLVIAGMIAGFDARLLPLGIGIASASALYILAGFFAIARYSSINEYFIPATLYAAALLVPLLPYINQWNTWLIYLHPLEAPLMLMRAAYLPFESWQIVYGILYSLFWIGIIYLLCRRAFRRYILAGGSV